MCQTEQFYYAKSQELLQLSIPEYIDEALKILEKEDVLAQKYYSTWQKEVIETIENVVIVKPTKVLGLVTHVLLLNGAIMVLY